MPIKSDQFLDRFFCKEDIENALDEIGISITGSKEELIKRLVTNWESHNRKFIDTLNYLEKDLLIEICDMFGLNSSGSFEKLKERIGGIIDPVPSYSRIVNPRSSRGQDDSPKISSISSSKSRKIFVVHGHDSSPKVDLAMMLEQIHLEPVVLHEQPNAGKSLILLSSIS